MFRRRHSILHQFPPIGPIRFDNAIKRHFETPGLDNRWQDSRVCLHASAPRFSSMISLEQRFFSTAWSRSRDRVLRARIDSRIGDTCRSTCLSSIQKQSHSPSNGWSNNSISSRSESILGRYSSASGCTVIPWRTVYVVRPLVSLDPAVANSRLFPDCGDDGSADASVSRLFVYNIMQAWRTSSPPGVARSPPSFSRFSH